MSLPLTSQRFKLSSNLKEMLLEQYPCEDPIEQKICMVKLFQGNSLLNDAQTLNDVGLDMLDAESEVSVVYTSNEIEGCIQT